MMIIPMTKEDVRHHRASGPTTLAAPQTITERTRLVRPRPATRAQGEVSKAQVLVDSGLEQRREDY